MSGYCHVNGHDATSIADAKAGAAEQCEADASPESLPNVSRRLYKRSSRFFESYPSSCSFRLIGLLIAKMRHACIGTTCDLSGRRTECGSSHEASYLTRSNAWHTRDGSIPKPAPLPHYRMRSASVKTHRRIHRNPCRYGALPDQSFHD